MIVLENSSEKVVDNLGEEGRMRLSAVNAAVL
jgi:hypothetical protein